jgi:PadR family transcriptional regulator PadR
MRPLSLNEEAVLLAIWKLGEEAYPVTIMEKVNRMMGRDMVYGTLYNTLDNLLKKGYVFAEKGDPTPERGGKRKVFFTLKKKGVEALKRNHEMHASIWKGAGDLLSEDEKV